MRSKNVKESFQDGNGKGASILQLDTSKEKQKSCSTKKNETKKNYS